MNNDNFGAALAKHYRAIIISAVVVVALCVIGLIVLLVSNISQPKTFLQISVAPGDALIEVNGQEYHNGIYEVEPGTYTAEISAEGFEPKTQEVTVAEGETAEISTYLLNEDEGMDYYLSSAGDIEILRGIGDQEVQNFLARYDQMVSIAEKFPIDASYNVPEDGMSYSQTISDGTSRPECEMAFCLLVTGYGQPNDEVIGEVLDGMGYNIEDYQIIYDFKSESSRESPAGGANDASFGEGTGEVYDNGRNNYVFTNYSLIYGFIGDSDASALLLDIINKNLEEYLGGNASQGYSSMAPGKDADKRIWFPYNMLSFMVEVSNGDAYYVQIALQDSTYLGMTFRKMNSKDSVRFYIDYMRPASEANYDSNKVVADLTRWAQKVNTDASISQPTIYVSY